MSNRLLAKLSLVLVLTLGILSLQSHPVKASIISDIRDKITSVFTKNTAKEASTTSKDSSVLGNGSYQSQPPSLYIHGDNNRYSSGGLITQASTDEPAIYISGYQIPSQLEIKLYKANKNDLFQYLVHDKDGNQLNKSLSTDGMQYEGTVAIDMRGVDENSYGSTRHTLPISGRGLWYLSIKGGSVDISAFILRSGHGVMVTEGQNELIYWAQDYETLRKKSDGGNLKLYSFLNSQNELASTGFDSSAIARTQLTDQADLAVSEFGDDFAILPINLTYLNTGYGYSEFRPAVLKSRYFTFTDRPLYGPGDTVHFKSIIRDDKDAEYSIPTGSAFVTLSAGGGETEYKVERTFPISADGTISGDFDLKDAPLGYYSLHVETTRDKSNNQKNFYGDYIGISDYSYTSFQVEHYRKPELFLEVSSNTSIVSAGTKIKYVISGEYFAGQPLSGEKIHYKVTSADYYEYSYLVDSDNYGNEELSDDYRYGSWYGSHQVVENTVSLDKLGQATIEVPTNLSDFNNSGSPQIFMLEATLDGGEQDSAFARKNVLVKAGRLSLFGTEYVWGSQKDKEVTLPIILKPNEAAESVNNIPVNVELTRTIWKKEVVASEKYPRYSEESFDEGEAEIRTNAKGEAKLVFTPSELGSYKLTMSVKDSVGNTVKKIFNIYVSDQEYPSFNPSTQSEDLSLTSPKDTYPPDAKVPFTVTSSFKNRDVFLSIERGTSRRFEVISLDGTSKTIDLALKTGDQPNIYLNASSFSSFRYDSTTLPITVETRDKKMKIDITPDRSKYGPGDTVTVKLKTTNDLGQPVSGEVALWSVDKALLELTDSRLGDIYQTFWTTRTNSTSHSHSLRGILVQVAERGGGCFLPGTLITMADGSKLPIEQVKVGDYVRTINSHGNLTTKRVSATHTDSSDGYLTVNDTLRLTADHLVNVNNTWLEASRIVPGDYLRSEVGSLNVNSVFYQAGITKVYNLTVEDEHTFLADDIWVHNEKGEGRSVFKDVAYWNPTVRTGSDGLASITFKLPDNLTTWTLNAVGSNAQTVVGQNQVEIKTTKDIVVKPILPNILRSGDELSISAIARNFTDQDDTYDFGLKIEGAELLDSPSSVVSIKSLESLQSYWQIKPVNDAKKVKIETSVISKSDPKKGDRVIEEIPVSLFGFYETTATVGDGNSKYDLELPKDAVNAQTKVTLSLAPSVITALQPAMQYLVHYPYGCVEQLTSSTAPTLIANKYPELFPDLHEGAELDTYIKEGIKKIVESHNSYSGWGWWSHAPVNSFVTTYVLETLVEAEKQGYTKETKEAIVDATNYLSQPQNEKGEELGNSERAIVRYGLSLVGKAEKFPKPEDLTVLEDDLLAMAVIGNYRAGDKNPDSNGLNLLLSKAQKEGNTAHWQSGHYSRFGSIDASTAWAVRAILTAGGDRDVAVAGANYLINSRRSNYWSNTYGTVITIRALSDLYENGGESTPDYSYSVILDGKELKSGSVKSAAVAIQDILIPVTKTNHQIEIKKTGEGQLYSSLVTKQYRTDPHVKAAANGITIERSYTNARDPDYNIALGDIVEVSLKVSGTGNFNRQGVIEDQLPAGLIPINESFKNEQNNRNSPYEYYSTKQYTQNGVVIAAYNLGTRTYTYRARVVSMGIFQIPPATASLMYSPEIYGRTGAEVMTISSESKMLPGKALEAALKKITTKQMIAAIAFILIAITTSLILYKRYKKNHLPPSTPIPPAIPDNPTPQV